MSPSDQISRKGKRMETSGILVQERRAIQKLLLFRVKDKAWQSLRVWGVFIVLTVIINGTIPFILGADLRIWSSSTAKGILFYLIVYSVLFLVVPLILAKGWGRVRQPAFLIPLCLTIVGIALLWPITRYAVGIIVPLLAYLHRRFDLSELCIRSCGWKGDITGIFLLALFAMLPSLMGESLFLNPGGALLAGANRLFGNLASTVENLFYFGFITERLSVKTGKWFTPILVGAMYTLHEMSNPEYWYEGMKFGFVFVAVVVAASIYLWRRSVVVTWLGDGLGKFLANLF